MNHALNVILIKCYKSKYYHYVKAQYGISQFSSSMCKESERERWRGETAASWELRPAVPVWSAQAGVCWNPSWIWPPFSLYTRTYSKRKLRNVHTQQSSLLRRVRFYRPGANSLQSHHFSTQYLSTKCCWLGSLSSEWCEQCSNHFY